MNCPKCGTLMEHSIVFNNMYCSNCDHNQGATEEQLKNIALERAQNRADMHGIRGDIEEAELEMCECVQDTFETSYILTNVTTDGLCVHQEICDDCNKALRLPEIQF